VGLFNVVSMIQRQVRAFGGPPALPRVCRAGQRSATQLPRMFEELEPRKLLAGDLHLGAVYFEEATGDDSEGDTIEVTFEGGAQGSQLTELIIDGDKKLDGLTEGDPFFDTAAGGAGAFQSVPLSMLSHDGFEVVDARVSDGGTRISFHFRDFDAGEKFVFSVDVDEASFVVGAGHIEATSVVEGGEFQRSHLVGVFAAPHHEQTQLSATFWDEYDDNFQQTTLAAGSVLQLPPDRYVTNDDLTDRTAGASVSAPQVPLPITISGHVFVDSDRDVRRDTGESGIADVPISLWVFDDEPGQYRPTGKTARTDADGFYRFDNRDGVDLLPGRYEVRETQPGAFFSVGAQPGTVAGSTRGAADGPDRITEIELVGGDNSTDNDFAEALPARLSGNVYHDASNDGLRDAGEDGIGGVSIRVVALSTVDGSDESVEVVTNDVGFWETGDLAPGEYRVVERAQPGGYLDGLDTAGRVGGVTVGVADNPGDAIEQVRIDGGQHGVEYNFGELLPGSIEGRVHAGIDGDCTLGPDDIFLAGVQIDLLDAEGALLDTAFTDEEGRYAFEDLRPGSYQVREHQPAQYLDGGEHVGSAGGTAAANDLIDQIRIASGTTAVDYDFCEHVPVSLSGFVYHDRNNDGQIDPEEEGIGGVTMVLLDAQGNDLDRHVTTSNDPDHRGFYRFDRLLAGTYGVRELQPADYLDGIDTPGDRGGAAENPGDRITGATLVGGADGAFYNFGELLPGRIEGRVHASTDGDCEIGPDDILLANVRIDLFDDAGNRLATTDTDQDGRYVFENLAPGRYQVFEHQPQGYFNGAPHVGTAGGRVGGTDRIIGIELQSTTVGREYNFCEHVGVELSGYVYHDADDDGRFDVDEQGIGGVTLELLDTNGNHTGMHVTTSPDRDALGYYEFTGLEAGTYGVRELQPAGYLDGTDTPGNQGGTAMNPGDQITGVHLPFGVRGQQYNFGELLPGSIEGRVHASEDDDCEIGPDHIFLAGVRIDLLGGTGQSIATTTTDAEGRYRFEGLAPGEYQVREHQPSEYLDGQEHVGTAGGRVDSNDVLSGIVLQSGVAGTDYNFCEHPPASLSGFVFYDADDNGVFDSAESGVGGVIVVLLDADGSETSLRTTTSTDADNRGFYVFSGLPAGTYGVREVQPSGFLDGKDAPGTHGGRADVAGDRITGAELAYGSQAERYNFGEVLPGSIGGIVHADPNQNCFFDPGESPLAGVVVELLGDAGAVIATTETAADGSYLFQGLAPGRYQLREQQPTDFFQGGQRLGSGGGLIAGADHITAIDVGSDEHLSGYDFCEIPPATLSGFVFQDGPPLEGLVPEDLSLLRDGALTGDDSRLRQVQLQLRDGATGEPILASQALPGRYPDGPVRAHTDARGFYEFTGLAPGNYAVSEVQPAGFIDGIDTAGTTGGIAINRHQPFSLALLSQLTVDVGTDIILRIPLGAGEVSASNNFSEVLVKPFWIPAPPIPASRPVPVAAAASAPIVPPLLFTQFASQTFAPEIFGGSSLVNGYTWHLSVVDGGMPRSTLNDGELLHLAAAPQTGAVWTRTDMAQADWTLQLLDIDSSEAFRRGVFGMRGATPVTGDFNGDGISEQAVFWKGNWFIDINGNGHWDDEDLWAKLGHDGDLPVTGDWDGDGKTDIGIFGPAWPGDPRAVREEPGLPDPLNSPSGRWKNVPPPVTVAAAGARSMVLTSGGKLRAHVVDHVFHYGTAGDRPIAGDWNGDGVDTIGVFRNGAWHVDTDGNGKVTANDAAFSFGVVGDIPVVGDWDADGIDDVGVFRAGRWILDVDGDRRMTTHDKVFQLGGPGDLPVVGDWNGDGVDDPGVMGESTSGQSRLAGEP